MRAFSCKGVKALYDEACQTGPWSIKFEETCDLVNGKYFLSNASCDIGERVIRIDPEISANEALTVFIFELTNAASQRELSRIGALAERGFLGKEAFVKAIERIEHKGALCHRMIINEGIRNLGWPPSLHRYLHVHPDFEVDWLSTRNSIHAESYRKDWEELYAQHHARRANSLSVVMGGWFSPDWSSLNQSKAVPATHSPTTSSSASSASSAAPSASKAVLHSGDEKEVYFEFDDIYD